MCQICPHQPSSPTDARLLARPFKVARTFAPTTTGRHPACNQTRCRVQATHAQKYRAPLCKLLPVLMQPPCYVSALHTMHANGTTCLCTAPAPAAVSMHRFAACHRPAQSWKHKLSASACAPVCFPGCQFGPHQGSRQGLAGAGWIAVIILSFCLPAAHGGRASLQRKYGKLRLHFSLGWHTDICF